MKITHAGNLNSGTLHDPLSGRNYPFEKGKIIEVPDAFGDRLLSEQGEEPLWVVAGASAAQPPAAEEGQ